MPLIAFNGLANSGKGAASEYLVKEKGFIRLSFARTVKDAVSVLFSLPRDLLEGDTEESRTYRESILSDWNEKLYNKFGVPITPRFLLQYFGTEVVRQTIDNDFWVYLMEINIKKLRESGIENIVIDDLRFPNEFYSVKNSNGYVYSIRRSEPPEWFQYALKDNESGQITGKFSFMQRLYPNVHYSEWALIKREIYDNLDDIIDNSGSIEDLKTKLDTILKENNNEI